MHEASAPMMRVKKAILWRLPPRFGHAERTHVELSLESDDGEIVGATIVVPREPDCRAAVTWTAVFPDIDPAKLLINWSDVAPIWKAIRWRHRAFEVAVRGGAVKWIRSVKMNEPEQGERGRGGRPAAFGADEP